MAKRKIDARRVKIHRSYTISEAALCLNVHKNTVKRWLREGLPHIRTPRPILILGEHLKNFLSKRRQQARRPCPTGHLFCLRCRTPRRPAGDMLDYEPITSTSGNLKGICEVCDTLMFRRAALAKIGAIAPDCHVSFPQCQQRLTETV